MSKSGLNQVKDCASHAPKKGYAEGGAVESQIRATPVKSEALKWLSEKIGQADKFNREPFGYNNVPGAFISDILGVPGIQKTIERVAYGDDLLYGRGMTTRMRPETETTVLAGLPMVAAPAARMVKVGAGMARRGVEADMRNLAKNIQEFAQGGYVEYDPHHIDYLMERTRNEFAAGGYVNAEM